MNKKEYWRNRKAGKRGQGEYLGNVTAYWTPKQWAEKKRDERNLRALEKRRINV